MIKADRRRWVEIVLVSLTGLGKFVFMDYLDWRLVYILTACLFWTGYVVYRYRIDKTALRHWGFTTKNFRKTFLELLPVAVVSVALFVGVGKWLGTNILNWHILPLLLLYPLWGIIQQFLIVGLITGNLRDMESARLPAGLIVLITAVVFAVVHFPFVYLVGGTFLLAIVYSSLYLKERNLIVMGIYHGWLGAFFFYTLLARDPWLEVFGRLG